MRIALISCSKSKQSYPCTAVEMYSASQLFSKCSSYVERQNYDRWFILSAKYGLLLPDAEIEPYDHTLHCMSAVDVQLWAVNVHRDLMQYEASEIDIYAGRKYRKYLIPLLQNSGVRCCVPLEGLEIGKQLQFYTEAM